jgi:hypothetical protein
MEIKDVSNIDDLLKYSNIEYVRTAQTIPYSEAIVRSFFDNEQDIYTYKNADIGIEWVLIEKVGEDGKPMKYLARRNVKKEKTAGTKTAAEILSDYFEYSNGEIYLKPSVCLGQQMGLTDYLTNGDVPFCIVGGSVCPYLGSAKISAINGDKDINCLAQKSDNEMEL